MSSRGGICSLGPQAPSRTAVSHSPPCAAQGDSPCTDLLCARCLYRNFHTPVPAVLTEYCETVSPTIPLNPYSAAAPSPDPSLMACEGARQKEVITVDGPDQQRMEVDVVVEQDNAESAPATPVRKREAGRQETSPMKQARSSTTVDQPSNNDILMAICGLQATGDQTKSLLSTLAEQMRSHDAKLKDIEYKLGVMQVGHDQEHGLLQKRIDEMQAAFEKNNAMLHEQHSELRAKVCEKAAPTAATSTGLAPREEIVVIGGFPQNTPKLVIEQGLRPLMKRINDSEFSGGRSGEAYAP